MAKKKKFDPKAKAKRQKVILAVGGVLLLGLLAFQVPRTMKLMKSQSQPSSSSSAPSTTATTGSTSLAPPTLDGSATAGTSSAAGSSAATAVTSADGVSDPSNPLPPSAGQLVSFSMFKSKDPFKQQITASCDTGTSSAVSAASGCATTAPSTPSTPSSPKPAAPTQKSATASAPKLVSVKPTTATISVNGIAGPVSVGGAFPSASPVFRLVALGKTFAKIGILGGTYDTGAATTTLTKGKNVTLQNTADGTRYVLRLVSTA